MDTSSQPARLALVPNGERLCRTQPRGPGRCGDPEIPVEFGATPRLRRFTAVWVEELRRQWGLPEVRTQ